MDRPWFDPVTGTLTFDQYVTERPSYQKVLQDGVVTHAEFHQQTQQVIDLFRKLEGQLTGDAKQIATEALAELAVLHALAAQARRGARP